MLAEPVVQLPQAPFTHETVPALVESSRLHAIVSPFRHWCPLFQ